MKLLGITDLAKRWYYTRQGVHLKMQLCESFPRPVATINKNILVFDEEEIAAFEQARRELTDAKYKRWYTHKRWLYKNE